MSQKKYKIAVIGHFGFGLNMRDGQTVKTVTVTQALERRFGSGEVLKKDTAGRLKALLKLPFQVISSLKKAQNIVFLPAQRGLRVIVPLLVFFNRFYHRKLHYCVIGGWLPQLLNGNPRLLKQLGTLYGIYTETSTVQNALQKLGLKNTVIVPNCKRLRILSESELRFNRREPYRLCTFSRVMREKGIEDAVKVVENINHLFGAQVYSLDIYGPVDNTQTEWFAQLKKQFSPAVKYMGSVAYQESGSVLKDYDVLLFPTRFYTEGIPGTIIDAYAAGVPVVSSRWESFSDLVEEGITGYGYAFENTQALEALLLNLKDNIEPLLAMKNSCLQKAHRYLPENTLQELFLRIES